MKKLLSVGEMVIDFLPGNEPASYIRKAGGAPANVAIAVARQGCKASFCGMMGNDDFGRFLLDTLEQNGVEPVIRKLTDDAVTTMAFVTLDQSGERSFTFARKPGADMFLTKAYITPEVIADADIIHAGSCSLSAGSAAEATRYALEQGHRNGKLISFDVNYRNLMWNDHVDAAKSAVMEVLPFIDLLKVSDEETEMFGGEEQLLRYAEQNQVSVVVETLGSKGARAFWKNKTIQVPGIKANKVDTTGAGDAFWGGFLACLMQNEISCAHDITEELLSEAMYRGNIAGAICVEVKGAIESLPTAHQIAAYMEAHCHE